MIIIIMKIVHLEKGSSRSLQNGPHFDASEFDDCNPITKQRIPNEKEKEREREK